MTWMIRSTRRTQRWSWNPTAVRSGLKSTPSVLDWTWSFSKKKKKKNSQCWTSQKIKTQPIRLCCWKAGHTQKRLKSEFALSELWTCHREHSREEEGLSLRTSHLHFELWQHAVWTQGASLSTGSNKEDDNLNQFFISKLSSTFLTSFNSIPDSTHFLGSLNSVLFLANLWRWKRVQISTEASSLFCVECTQPWWHCVRLG